MMLKLLSIFMILNFFYVIPVKSASSCTASISPSSAVRNTTTNFIISPTNSGSTTINWIKITRPSPVYYTLTSGSASGWSTSVTADYITFTGSLSAASATSLTITAAIANYTSSSIAWTVESSDNNGSTTSACTGSLGTSTTNIPADEPPIIYTPTVSDVTQTSVKISWTTNESTTSAINYGLSNSYGSSKTSSTNATSHSFTLDNLTANTLYYFELSNTDSGSNVETDGPYTFTSSQAATTITQTNTTTVPSVAITFDSTKIYSKSPQITGSTTDNNSNISSVDYSTNNGITWNPVNYLSSTTAKSAIFNFTPKLSRTGTYSLKVRARNAQGNYGFTNSISLVIDADPPVIKINTDLSKPLPPDPKISLTATDKYGITSLQFSLDEGTTWQDFDTTLPLKSDDNYQVLFRATDTPGNTGLLTVNLIIDRLPPRIASPIFSNLSQILFGNTFLSQSDIKLSLSLIGGVTQATVSAKSASQTLSFAVKNNSATLNFPVSDIWHLTVSALDGAGNSVITPLPQITTLPPGKIISDNQATLSIYQYDPTTNNFRLWSADSYNYLNPLTTNNSFWLYLPAGKYYLKASSFGYRTQITPIFELSASTPINPIFKLTPWPFKLPLFWFPSLTSYQPAKTNASELDTQISKQSYFPRGQNHLIILATPASPYFNSVINFLSEFNHPDIQASLVLSHQALIPDLPKNLRVLPDPDGDISLLFPVISNPQILLLDRQNHLRAIFSLPPSPEQLSNMLILDK